MYIRFVAAGLLAASIAAVPLTAAAADTQSRSIASLNENKAALAGQTVSAHGKVVKVNNGIMGRNFVHVQDGSGDAAAGTHNLIVTSKQTARVGDEVTVSGTVVVNRDFGSGYLYPLLIEDCSITPDKK
jgi:hypothetical protein